jgi:hypothetical protein
MRNGQCLIQAIRSYRWLPVTARVVDVEDSSFVIDVVQKYSSERQSRFTQYTCTFRFTVGTPDFQTQCYCFGTHVNKGKLHSISETR